MHDVIVVGGGPGGLHAARLLARDGFDVVVTEEHERVGEPVHCTGVLAAEAFAEFDIPRTSILNPLETVQFVSPSGITIEHSTATTEALVVDRAEFDRTLQAQAVAAGAMVESGVRVSTLERHGTHVVALRGDGRRIEARVAVLACGANYRLHRQIGLGMPAAYLRSAQLELPAEHDGKVEVHFGHEVAPKGFAWVVPVARPSGRFARIGLMCDAQAAGYFTRFVERVAGRWNLSTIANGQPLPRPRQKILPLAPIRRTYGDRILAIGDAAGLVKATTGGGIYYSLVSAAAAAAVLGEALRADSLRSATLKQYERIWRARLGSELRAQYALRLVSHRLGDRDIDALFDLARTNGVMPIVRRTARFNYHRDFIVSLFKHPPARRLLFRQLVARSAVVSLQ